ncbi:uncharacterized protein C8A04DRAFT_27842 [Dichotomopilus funicola]|uniref:Uncharacterized protein n=1 Tax=Dichotomopilus funicola TaxID=1934379 RepID=A0AAN6V3W8_9PEZI|nr:hypothetical protein C8A04DRAFT_27842 [Dichotomopilus funicola]
MIPFLAALVLLVGAIAPALAHSQSQLRSLPDDDTSQYCVFTLASNNLILGQIEGGQVVGISQSAAESKSNSSSGGGGDGSSGTIFFLRGEGLYDFAMRGCWWPEPSTVLVCSLQPPAYPDPLFHLDESGQLVYNHTRREFWACPVATGDADDNTHIWSYYLNLPEGRQAGAHGEECLFWVTFCIFVFFLCFLSLLFCVSLLTCLNPSYSNLAVSIKVTTIPIILDTVFNQH